MTRRIDLLVFGFVLGVLLNGCQKHVAAQTYEVVTRPGYAYQRVNDGNVVVAADNERGLSNAMKEIGCGVKYVCLIEEDGQLYNVQQRKK